MKNTSLMLYRGVITVYFENHIKHKNTQWENSSAYNLKVGATYI